MSFFINSSKPFLPLSDYIMMLRKETCSGIYCWVASGGSFSYMMVANDQRMENARRVKIIFKVNFERSKSRCRLWIMEYDWKQSGVSNCKPVAAIRKEWRNILENVKKLQNQAQLKLARSGFIQNWEA